MYTIKDWSFRLATGAMYTIKDWSFRLATGKDGGNGGLGKC